MIVQRRTTGLLATLLWGGFFTALLAGTAASQDDTPVQSVVIGTGSLGGVYFAVGNAICRLAQRPAMYVVSEAGRPLPCAAKSTGGSVPNLEALRAGSIEIAITQSDWVYHAVRGTSRFEGRRMDKLRTLFSLHAEPFQLLVARNLGVDGFANLKGRKINIGPKGSAQNEIFTDLFQLHKLDPTSFAQLATLPASEQLQAFCDGDVEVLGMMIGYPNSGFAAAIRNCNAQLVDVDSEPIRKMVAAKPSLTVATIPRGTYPAMAKDVVTFGAVAVVTATSDADFDTVYRLVRAVFERIDDLRAMHPALAGLDPRRMVRDGLTAPLHPAALKYYKERGWL